MDRQTITVDIAPGSGPIQRIRLSQGDIGRPMGVYIIQNGVALDCSAYSAELYILKPDGKFYTTQATVDATETNLIKWETALQETPVAGACAAQIRITAGDDDIGTARFVEFVEASPCDMGSASESEVALLTEYVRQAHESAESAERDAETASGAASSASGSASTATTAANTATQAATAATAAADRAEEVEESILEDYSQLSDDVTDLKSAVNDNLGTLFSDNYIGADMTAESSVNGWRLNANDGLCSSNADYKMVKYKVSEGNALKIVSSDRFQFQTSSSVPSSGTPNRVSLTYGSGTFFVAVPKTATYLIVSQALSDETTSVQKLNPSITEVKAEVSGLKNDLRFISIASGAGATTGKYINTSGTISNNKNYAYILFPYKGGSVDIEGANTDNGIIDYFNSSDELLKTSGWVALNGLIDSADIPTGTSYMTISFNVANIETIAIYGNKLTETTTILPQISSINDSVTFMQISRMHLESGSYQDANGNVKVANNKRIRNAVPVPINGYKSIVVPSGYDMWIFCLDATYSLVRTVGFWQGNTITVGNFITSETEFINFAIRKTSAQTSDISADVQTVEDGLKFISGSDFVAWESEVDISVKNARHVPENSGMPLTLLHFSDLHADQSALSRIADYAEKHNQYIDDIICTGDIVGNTASQISSWWNPHILTCIGNHDSASYSSETGYNWTALSMANRDEYYIAPFESNWGITHTSGTSYYYKDYNDQNVRMIVMDGMLYTDNGAEATAQTSWLDGLLADAITNNLHVLIAIHSPHGGATAKECSFSRYGQGTMPTYSDCNTPQAVIDAVAAKITGGLHFIGYIVGHTHQDNIWDAEDNGTQLMYCITCAAVSNVNRWENSDQYRGADADAYNIVTIDTENTLVKIVRGGGADMDDHMRTRKAICFNYSTGEKVGEVL